MKSAASNATLLGFLLSGDSPWQVSLPPGPRGPIERGTPYRQQRDGTYLDARGLPYRKHHDGSFRRLFAKGTPKKERRRLRRAQARGEAAQVAMTMHPPSES